MTFQTIRPFATQLRRQWLAVRFNSSVATPSQPKFDSTRPIATTQVKWIEGMNFEGTDNDGRKTKISGGAGEGVSPMNMLLLALGSCSSVDVVTILKKQKQDLRGIDISIQGQRSTVLPKPYETAHVTFKITGKGITQERAEAAIALSTEKYCGVHGTLSKAVNITWSAEVVEVD